MKKSKQEKKADQNSLVLSSLDSNRPSKEQEEILLAAFRQWPVAFPELVEALVKETKLEGSQVITFGELDYRPLLYNQR